MASNREPTFRVFSKKKETAYGTALSLGSADEFLVNFQDEPTIAVPDKTTTDENEYTGKRFLTEFDIERWKVELTHARRLMPNEFALFSALLLGSVTSDQPDAGGAPNTYRHIIEYQDAINLPSVTMWEQTPDLGQKVFPGIGCSQLVLKISEGEFCSLAASLIGDGCMGAGGDLSGKSLIDGETYLKYPGVDFKIGGTYSEAAGIGSVSGGTSKKGKLVDLTLTMKNGANKRFGYGNVDGFADALRKQGLKATDLFSLATIIEPDDATELDDLASETERAVEISIEGATIETTYKYKVNVIFPIMRVINAKKGRDGSVLRADLDFMALKDTSANNYPIVQIQIINKQTAYLN